MTNELDREFDDVCFGVAADVLAQELDAENSLFDFAVATVRTYCRSEKVSKVNLDFELFASELRRRAGQSDDLCAAEFIGEFVTKMFNDPTTSRINSKKSAQYELLCAAACRIECKKDKEIEPTLLSLLGRAEYHLSIEIDETAFRAAIMNAFRTVVTRPDFSFVELEKAIRGEQKDVERRRFQRELAQLPTDRKRLRISMKKWIPTKTSNSPNFSPD